MQGELQRMGSLRRSLSRQGSLTVRQRDPGLSISMKPVEDDEEALMWASLERLPTYARMRTGILTMTEGEQREVDVNKLGLVQKKALLDRLIKTAQEDNERFLMKLRDRIDRCVRAYIYIYMLS